MIIRKTIVNLVINQLSEVAWCLNQEKLGCKYPTKHLENAEFYTIAAVKTLKSEIDRKPDEPPGKKN